MAARARLVVGVAESDAAVLVGALSPVVHGLRVQLRHAAPRMVPPRSGPRGSELRGVLGQDPVEFTLMIQARCEGGFVSDGEGSFVLHGPGDDGFPKARHRSVHQGVPGDESAGAVVGLAGPGGDFVDR